MGSGKSTVGNLLGRRHNLPVIDLDQAIEEAAGQTIPEIFADHGEAYFRKLEHQVLGAVIDQPGILATGGGTPSEKTTKPCSEAQPSQLSISEPAPRKPLPGLATLKTGPSPKDLIRQGLKP